VSLLERSSKLAASASELERLREVSQQAKALQSRADSFDADLTRTRLAVDSYRRLAGRGLAIAASTQSAAGIGHFARDLRAKVEADPSVILSPDLNVAPQLRNPLKTLLDDLERATKEAWGSHVENAMPPIKSDLLDVLSRIPGLKSDVDSVRSLWNRLIGLAEKVPSTDEAITFVDTLVGEINKSWQNLDAASLPAEVVTFLRAAIAPTGAALGLLTPTVLNWLQQHQLQGSFAIKTR
jgi:hypothetical protein